MTIDKSRASRDHFSRLVQQWSHFGPPLRPSPDDTAAVQQIIAELGRQSRAVVLGLTPEIIGCAWPDDIDLAVVDHSPAMIGALWPPQHGPAGARVILADWCAMPLASATLDLVVGDGCYIMLTYPAGFATLTQEVCRVLRPGGRFAIRVFLRPERVESIAAIAGALADGQIGSVHALKLRLLAAVHGASGMGSSLDEVWRASTTLPPVPAALANRRGWTPEERTGLENYRGLSARYYLPTLAEIRAALSGALIEVQCLCGRHELAERCPTLVLARR